MTKRNEMLGASLSVVSAIQHIEKAKRELIELGYHAIADCLTESADKAESASKWLTQTIEELD